MAARLTLVCHAASGSAAEAGFPMDEPAEPAALAAVPGLLPALGQFARLLAAPELRVRQTADALQSGASVAAALRDGDFGTWRGRRLADIAAADPAGAAAWIEDMAASPHGGESLLDVLARTAGWLDGLDEKDHVVAVTHPAVIRAAIVHALGAPPKAFWRVDVLPLSLTDLRRNGRHWTLRATGRVA
jgi:broad specificity phosphatase PhoE